MTIAAGFVCRDGIVLCTDSQYTAWEKSQSDKILPRPYDGGVATFAIIGDVDYARTAIDEGMQAVSMLPTKERHLWGIRKALRQGIKTVLDDYSQQKHLDQVQKPEFLVAVNARDGTKLFSCRESAFPIVESCEFRGTGSYLAAYVAASAGRVFNGRVESILPLAFRIIAAAKRHDLACGGGYQFAVIRGALVSTVFGYHADETDDLISEFESLCGMLFADVTDWTINDDVFERCMSTIGEGALRIRKSLMAERASYRGFVNSLMRLSGQSNPQASTPDSQSPLPSPG